MGHVIIDGKNLETTPSEWLSVGANVTELVNLWAGRFDLVTMIGPGIGNPNPACFIPSTAEILIDTDAVFARGISPAMIGDLSVKKNQYEYPKAIGAIMHESFHARYSGWNIDQARKDLKQDEFDALILLEESRIEKFGLSAISLSANFLRSAVMEIVIKDAEEQFSTSSNTGTASFLVGLVNSRIIAGVLTEEEVKPITDLVYDFLGYEFVQKLEAILEKFQAHDSHRDISPVYPLAVEWAELVREKSKENGEQPSESGESGESGESESTDSDFAEALREAMQEVAGAVAVAVGMDLGEEQTEEEWKKVVSERSSLAKEQGANKDVATEVFNKTTGPGESRTSSYLIEARRPESGERIAAVKVAQMLERAKYRERDAVEIKSALPPGRLRTRALVQGTAQRSRGMVAQVEPWRRTVRKHTDDPTLTVGVMVDISGSMSSAMQPMATTAWVMSEAVKRVQGKCAMVYFGNDVFPTLKAGQHLDEVTVYSASDGTEKFDKAFRALDGSLNLLNGNGARLLVVVSDGEYVPQEITNAKRTLEACDKNGVGVLWLPFTSGSNGARMCAETKAVALGGKLDPTEASIEIGKACAKALENASS